MSVRFLFIRTLSTKQVNSTSSRGLSYDDFPVVEHYQYLETFSMGWSQGARTRIKRFSNPEKVYAYLNKLHIHGYLTDNAYDEAWELLIYNVINNDGDGETAHMPNRIRKSEGSSLNEVAWELFPYDFRAPGGATAP